MSKESRWLMIFIAALSPACIGRGVETTSKALTVPVERTIVSGAPTLDADDKLATPSDGSDHEAARSARRHQEAVERWVAKAIRTAWDGKSYNEPTCFDAAGHRLPCGSSQVSSTEVERGVEYVITVASQVTVPLECSIEGGSTPVSFPLPPEGDAHGETVKVPSSTSQVLRLICEAPLNAVLSTADPATEGLRARVTIERNLRGGGASTTTSIER